MPARAAHDPALAAVIGANVRSHRIRMDRTLCKVASATGLSESMLCRVERGLALPSVSNLMRIATALGVEAGALFVTPAREPA